MNYLKDQAEIEKGVLWMKKAGIIAEKALCRKAKCGAIIVKNGEVIGEGYNAPPLDREENRVCDEDFKVGKPRYDQTCCVHAEWRAILDASKRNAEKLHNSILYFTRVDEKGILVKSGKPFCTVCSRLALDSGILTFVLWHEEGICEYPTHEYNRLSYEYSHYEK